MIGSAFDAQRRIPGEHDRSTAIFIQANFQICHTFVYDTLKILRNIFQLQD